MFLAILLKKGHITLLISCTPTYGWCNAAWCTALCRSCRWSCLLCTPHKHQALLSSPKHDHSQLAAEKQTKKKKKPNNLHVENRHILTAVQQMTTAENPFSSKSKVNISEQEAVQISWRSALQHFNIKLQIGGERFNRLPHTARRYRRWNCPASTECRPSPCWPGRRRSRSLQRSSTACTHLDLEGSKTNRSKVFTLTLAWLVSSSETPLCRQA